MMSQAIGSSSGEFRSTWVTSESGIEQVSFQCNIGIPRVKII
jgi:hypothetical protein